MAALLVPALLAYRSDPWLSQRVLFDALRLASEIGFVRAPEAEQLLQILQQPFALEAYGDERLKTLVQIAERLDRQRMCRELLSNVEPDVFWEQSLLTYRRDCYLVTRDSRLKVAQEEHAYESRRMRLHSRAPRQSFGTERHRCERDSESFEPARDRRERGRQSFEQARHRFDHGAGSFEPECQSFERGDDPFATQHDWFASVLLPFEWALHRRGCVSARDWRAARPTGRPR